MLVDCRDLAVTASDAEVVGRFDRTVTSFLRHSNATADDLAATLDADPDMTLALAAKGFFQKLLGRRELDEVADRALAAARNSLAERGGTQRERKYVDALAASCAGDLTMTVVRLEEIITDHPIDALAIKLCHAFRFVAGDAVGMHASTARVLPSWGPGIPDYPFILGCHAFGLEETGQYDAAERTGRYALEMEPCDAWGLHAVAHVMEMRDQPSVGIAWISEHASSWTGCNNFAFHVQWHRALFHLALQQHDAVLELYDHHVRDCQTDDYRDISNAASLLWRLTSRGVDVGERWSELADLAERRTGDHSLVFADGHYLLSLLGAGRRGAVERLARSLGHSARWRPTVQARVARHVGVALADAMLALARRDPGRAVDLLLPVHGRLWCIGGSHAQRDVFAILLIDTAIAAGRREVAHTLLRDRLARRPDNRWAHRRLREVDAGGRPGVRPAA